MRPCVCRDPDVNRDFVPTGYPGFQTATYTSRSYAGITPGYTYQFPGNHSTLLLLITDQSVRGNRHAAIRRWY